jgi:hypothetical protein
MDNTTMDGVALILRQRASLIAIVEAFIQDCQYGERPRVPTINEAKMLLKFIEAQNDK